MERLRTSSLRERAGRGAWAPDSAACAACSVPFTLLRRRHHCRACLRCVCSTCAPAAAVRLCRACLADTADEPADSSSPIFEGALGHGPAAVLGSSGQLRLGTLVLRTEGTARADKRTLWVGGRALACRSEMEAGRWTCAIAPGAASLLRGCYGAGRGLVALRHDVVRVFGALLCWRGSGKRGGWTGSELAVDGVVVAHFDGRSCRRGDGTELLLAGGGASLSPCGQLLARDLVATVAGRVCLPLVVMLAMTDQ